MQAALKRNEYLATGQYARRTVKMDGNVAYISNNNVRRPPAVAKPAPKAAVRPVAKKAVNTAARPRAGVASTLIVLFIAFCALAVLVSRYAMVCSIGSQNNSLKKDIRNAEVMMEELKLKMELRDDLQYVRDTAQNELGMTYPVPEQKIHVNLSS